MMAPDETPPVPPVSAETTAPPPPPTAVPASSAVDAPDPVDAAGRVAPPTESPSPNSSEIGRVPIGIDSTGVIDGSTQDVLATTFDDPTEALEVHDSAVRGDPIAAAIEAEGSQPLRNPDAQDVSRTSAGEQGVAAQRLGAPPSALQDRLRVDADDEAERFRAVRPTDETLPVERLGHSAADLPPADGDDRGERGTAR